MAKYGDGVNYGKSIDPSSANVIDPGLLGGKIRVFQDTAVVSATSNLNSSGYIIVGGKLPTGSQVVKIIIGSSLKALSTNNALIVGDEGDDDRYMTSVQLTTNAVAVGPTVPDGMYYTVTGVTDNYIRIKGAVLGSILSAGTIKISVMYVVE